MKTTLIIIGLILTVGLLTYFTKSKNAEKVYAETSNDTDDTKQNDFEKLRSIALSVTPKQLGLSLPADNTIVYGIVMDWGMGGATATTVAFTTGDASLYLSSGGGVIGGGRHENVNSAAKKFIDLAQDFVADAKKTDKTPLPKTDQVIFYLLTNNGTFAGEAYMKDFKNKSSKWLTMFEEGNKVLSELRVTTEK